MTPGPYRGLVPYSENDAAYFFGRDTDRRIIASNLTSSRFTLLYGPSGVGKTSALRAGVVRDLREEARRNTRELGLPEFAVVWLSTWRGSPVEALEQAVRAAVADAMAGDGGPVSGTTPLERLEAWCERLNGELLLVLDQFEEYFLYHPTDTPGDFGDLMARIVAARTLRINVLVSLRDDALSQMDRFKGRIPGLFANFLRIERLDRAAGRLAIDGPVARWNELHAKDGDDMEPYVVEPDLREAVLDQVRVGRQGFGEKGRGIAEIDSQGREEIETPFLQLVMQRIWSVEQAENSHRLRLETLNRLGGAEEILRTHLSRVLNHLDDEGQKIARKVFYYLVTPSGTKIAHSARDLATYAELPEDRIEAVLARLCDRQSRILREVGAPDGGDGKRYEIYHDVLGSAILEWQRETRMRTETDRLLAERADAERLRQSRLRRVARTNWIILMLAVLVVGAFYWARAAQIEDKRQIMLSQLNDLRITFLRSHQEVFGAARAAEAAARLPASVQPPPPQSSANRLGDILKDRLAPFIEQEMLAIIESDGSVLLRLQGPELFASGTATLNDAYRDAVLAIADVVSGGAADKVAGSILIAGHTDNVPLSGKVQARFTSNLDLSLARAQAVASLLSDRLDRPERLIAEGRGETEPLTDNTTWEGRAANRRVEITLRKAF